MPQLSKASNVPQRKYILYDITGFTKFWHLIPVAIKSIQLSNKTCTWLQQESKASNIVQNIFDLYDVTGFT